MILTASPDSTFTPCPAGTFLARCCRVIDMGTQPVEYQGEAKPAHKVLLTFEVVDPETHREDGGCYTLSKRYTASLHEKAALRRDLEAWRGAKFTDAELRHFDLAGVLGKQALLSVVHVEKDGRSFANISALVRPPKGMTGSEPTEPLLHFDLAAPNWPLFDQLGERLRSQIASSPEYAAARSKPKQSTSFDDMPNDLDAAF